MISLWSDTTNALSRWSRDLQRFRDGFTLIELLVVLTIISILASLSLAGLFATRQRTKIVRTETTIRKIHEVVMPHYERLITRRLRELPAITVVPGLQAKANAGMELIARRRLAALELPDGWAEVYAPDTDSLKVEGPPVADYVYQTAISRRMNNIAQSWVPAPTSPPTDPLSDAECLWAAVIRGGFADPAIISHFRADEFSDADRDGRREFADAWNNPIRFLRWAPFFISRYQPGPDDQTQDHDAFDVAGVDPLARCTLFPLIFSGGPDGVPNIEFRDSDNFSYASVSYDPYYNLRHPVRRSHMFLQQGAARVDLAEYKPGLAETYFIKQFGHQVTSSSDDVHNHSMSR